MGVCSDPRVFSATADYNTRQAVLVSGWVFILGTVWVHAETRSKIPENTQTGSGYIASQVLLGLQAVPAHHTWLVVRYYSSLVFTLPSS